MLLLLMLLELLLLPHLLLDGFGEDSTKPFKVFVVFPGEAWGPGFPLSGLRGLGIGLVLDAFGVGLLLVIFDFSKHRSPHRFGSQDGSK